MKKILTILLVLGLTGQAQARAITLEGLGDVGQFTPTVMALALIAEQKDIEGFKEFFESSAAGAGLTYGMKYSLDQQRPNKGHYSMPSGHMWAAMNGAGFIQYRYGWPYALPGYAITGLVGYSRVQVRAHYPQDIFIGALIGTLSNYLFVHRIQIKPFYSQKTLGLNFSQDL